MLIFRFLFVLETSPQNYLTIVYVLYSVHCTAPFLAVCQELRRSAEGCREVELFTVSPDGSLKSVAHRLVQIGLAAR